MEPCGCNRWQSVAIGESRKPQKEAKSVATGCDRLPAKFHGKQGVCRGLPPVAGGPLPAREEVDGGGLWAICVRGLAGARLQLCDMGLLERVLGKIDARAADKCAVTTRHDLAG